MDLSYLLRFFAAPARAEVAPGDAAVAAPAVAATAARTRRYRDYLVIGLQVGIILLLVADITLGTSLYYRQLREQNCSDNAILLLIKVIKHNNHVMETLRESLSTKELLKKLTEPTMFSYQIDQIEPM